MGYRSHFAVREAGQTRLYASHWGGYRLLRDLLHGPATFRAYVETRKPCDEPYYGSSVDGVALLDLDTRTLWFWGGDNLEIESVPALRRPYLALLAARWPGWMIRWMSLGWLDFAAALGVPAGEITGLGETIEVGVLVDLPDALAERAETEGPQTLVTIVDGPGRARDYTATQSPEALLSLGPALLELAQRSAPTPLPRETLPDPDDELWPGSGGLILDPNAGTLECWWNWPVPRRSASLDALRRFWPTWTLRSTLAGHLAHAERSARPHPAIELPLALVALELEDRLFGEDELELPRLGAERLPDLVETFGEEAAATLFTSGVLSHDTGLDYPWELRGQIATLLARGLI